MIYSSGAASQDQFKFQLKSVEKIPIEIWENNSDASKHIAKAIAQVIKENQKKGQPTVLGLATGSSPVKVYEELVHLHKKDGLSFSDVYTFNLDEYYPMQPDAVQSYVRFMHEHLFNHIDIPKENIHIPDGTIPMDSVQDYCDFYEQKIESLGGLDVQLLGIGRTGHIGFNEPGSWETSKTRLVRLDNLTREDAKEDFTNQEVPYRAITMGIDTIMKAKQIHIMAWGAHKAPIVKIAVEDEVSSAVPSSFLQNHDNTQFYIDRSAASELTRFKTPWLVGICNWNDDLITKAVTWLSEKLSKPILKLTNEDYNENNLSDLIIEEASAYQLNIRVFNRLQHTITGWPGGKPNADDSTRPERAKPGKKRVIIFSPHPDDDVISMGGTFLRLVDQGHEVHVAYQTSGNIAVHDHDALKYIEFYNEYVTDVNDHSLSAEMLEAEKSIRNKLVGQMDSDVVRKIKGLIRKGEARAGARFCGLEDTNIHFLNLPFYETGKTKKKVLSQNDISIVRDLIEDVKPHQVYAAGDLADPHGTHRVCLESIFQAFDQLKKEKWMRDCWLWLYRGAWHEYPIDEIEMAVPLSPEELLKKRKAIFMHQSQKDSAPFPGEDAREFWQRAEDRNREAADTYRKLGFAEYEAIEAFRRWKFDWQ
jgi:glucosamine-6-phosphate deaminase